MKETVRDASTPAKLCPALEPGHVPFGMPSPWRATRYVHPFTGATLEVRRSSRLVRACGFKHNESPRACAACRAAIDARAEWARLNKVTGRVRALVFERDGHCCQHCGSTERLTIDHVVPLARFGPSTPANLQVLCKSCNTRKGARLTPAVR